MRMTSQVKPGFDSIVKVAVEEETQETTTTTTAPKKAKGLRIYKRSSEIGQPMLDVTMMCGAIEITGSVKGACRKLTVEVLRDDQDYYLSQRTSFKRGDALVLESDECDDYVFYGLIWEIEEDDAEMQKTVICYDNMKYLLTSDVITNTWSEVTAAEITQTVCDELGVKFGSVPDTDVKVTVNARGKKGYEAIMIAWTETRKETEKYYYPTMVGDELHIIERGELLEDCKLKYQPEALKNNLTNVKKKESSEEAVTSLWKRGEDGEAVEVETDEELNALLGYIVGVNDDTQNTDQDKVKEINDGKIELEASAIGDWRVRTGWSVPLASMIATVDGLYVEEDIHHYENGIHTMNLKLSFENSMDEQQSAQEQITIDGDGNIFAGIMSGEGDGVYTGSVGWPFAGGAGTVTQGFGGAYGHRGWDISTTGGYGAGSPVLAVEGGVVVGAGWQLDDWSYGNAVTIQHTNGLCTRYAHLSSISVSAGMKVSKGQQIGVEGNTGNSFGTHLHIEFLSSLPWGSLYNPGNYLSR